ncbi:hypothetical protein AJ79_02063 [Helicocarpus griseus UAMH5409]|uniref:DOC domain-containing protein n=1 Tax=Helicocarpus griseus UAMH5409 TaxID=1447875 RepID=A0A2B7Y329_9EURO|nr:hypothetical protein AJ79_02063 [Helicocarpus griseus UAMH5409]
MPRHGLRRAHAAFPSEDGASASTPTADPPPRATNFHAAAAAGRDRRNPRNSAIAGDYGIAGAEGAGEDDDVDPEDEEEGGGAAGELGDEEADGEGEGEGEEELEDAEEEEEDYDEKPPTPPLPPNLREISSLASWTVSTHKPGCGIAALRHPSPAHFWQSDGPQPHTLTLHFFKRVSIVRIRVYLDFELDESYTPTKMVFLAGMGGNDLVEFAVWTGEAPAGWVDVDLSGAGGTEGRGGMTGGAKRRSSTARRRRRAGEFGVDDSGGRHHNDNDDTSDDDDGDRDDDGFGSDADLTPGSVLKAMVLQVRISENHQNGKDTHVRGFQVFARDDRRLVRPRRESGLRKSLSSGHGAGGSAAEGMKGGVGGAEQGGGGDGEGDGQGEDGGFAARFDEDEFLGEMEIR